MIEAWEAIVIVCGIPLMYLVFGIFKPMFHLGLIATVWRFPVLAIIYTLYKSSNKNPTETILMVGGASYLNKNNQLHNHIKKQLKNILTNNEV